MEQLKEESAAHVAARAAAALEVEQEEREEQMAKAADEGAP